MELPLAIEMMKHKLDNTTFIGKQWKIKELEKPPTIVELNKIIFWGCTRGNVWTLKKDEVKWAKMVGFP